MERKCSNTDNTSTINSFSISQILKSKSPIPSTNVKVGPNLLTDLLTVDVENETSTTSSCAPTNTGLDLTRKTSAPTTPSLIQNDHHNSLLGVYHNLLQHSHSIPNNINSSLLQICGNQFPYIDNKQNSIDASLLSSTASRLTNDSHQQLCFNTPSHNDIWFAKSLQFSKSSHKLNGN
jgi:hypothetical protein